MKKILFTVFAIFSFSAQAAFPTAVNSQITDSAVEEKAIQEKELRTSKKLQPDYKSSEVQKENRKQ